MSGRRTHAGGGALGCAALTMLAMLTLVAPEAAAYPRERCGPNSPRSGCQMASDGQCGPRSDCQMPRGETAADCEDATTSTRQGGSGGLNLIADVPAGTTVAPGQEIALRLTWDPKDWSADRLDLAMNCVRVKGALDPDLSAQERPSTNDGTFEYRLKVPDNIRANCDICVQGFLAGPGSDGWSEQVGSNEQCFMSGPAETTPPPANQGAAAPPPPNRAAGAPPPASTKAPAPSRAPAEVPVGVAGGNVSRPGPAPAADAAPIGELPRTGHSFAQVGAASAGLTLVLGGLALIGGAGRRHGRRFAR